ncbi:MAG: hypothetical protein EMLJLAPB_01195 [Candidatus Argoarchaeum ethanivorans]|uniref:Uncharacterized protein n=1 Tax=Candidatus Argoarchaeum ethanivorans TaxID=2608793 RepID=A0A811TH69_9EURY|nr:MAG: hypothetical protein EMLJLAPB_01195 [Candidatus Argoarchaeum ethanivorans]
MGLPLVWERVQILPKCIPQMSQLLRLLLRLLNLLQLSFLYLFSLLCHYLLCTHLSPSHLGMSSKTSVLLFCVHHVHFHSLILSIDLSPFCNQAKIAKIKIKMAFKNDITTNSNILMCVCRHLISPISV